MSAVVQCRTSPPSAVTVMAAAYTNPNCYYWGQVTTFSGFRLSSPSDAVGFTAELSTDQKVLPSGRIFFDHAVSNIGNHYRPLHGFFTCPRDG